MSGLSQEEWTDKHSVEMSFPDRFDVFFVHSLIRKIQHNLKTDFFHMFQRVHSPVHDVRICQGREDGFEFRTPQVVILGTGGT